MSMKIGFFTGARSEYGLSKSLLRDLVSDKRFKTLLYVNGMHFLKEYGYTASEIFNDGSPVHGRLKTYSGRERSAGEGFLRSVDIIGSAMRKSKPDMVVVSGDRLEAYSAALAAHFSGIPVAHIGGGALTKGAVDDIYRYNISYLSTLHFATSKGCFSRLSALPGIDRNRIYLVGSTAVDSINKFKKNPAPVSDHVPGLAKGTYVLMTFHPVTRSSEPVRTIMDRAIDKVIGMGLKVLITFPNNDAGSAQLIGLIEKRRMDEGVFVVKHLGAEAYYAAVNDCLFVVGNSSSGVIEAPYFGRTVINVGSRQDGREKDAHVKDVRSDPDSVNRAISAAAKGAPAARCAYIYGRGGASKKIKEAMASYLSGAGRRQP